MKMTTTKILGGFGLVALCLIARSAHSAQPNRGLASFNPYPVAPTVEGTRLTNYESVLKGVFPEAKVIKEYTYLPVEWGGFSLMGLIGRLVGDRAHEQFEGLKTRRFLYRAYGKNESAEEVLGVAHGSTIDINGAQADVFVFYNPDTSIRDVRIDKVPSNVLDQLQTGGFLKQFVNRKIEDFSVVLGRRGRVKDWGLFAREMKKPREDSLREYFTRIVRSVRFNAAFVEVAYFISQHPDTGTQGALSTN